MKIKLLALLVVPALMSASAMASEHNKSIAYMTSWGLSDGDAQKLEKSKVDTFLLSFGKWDSQGKIETSDNIATAPAYDPWWMPTAYISWTQLKHTDPDKKFMIAFGGQTYESIWSEITTPEKREVIANSLANLLKQPYPVYKKNLKTSEMEGECLNWNWNGTQCDMTTYQRAGTVYLDGIDFDFEKAARLTEKENSDLLELAKRVRQLIGKDKLLSLTTYHVGADPVECADSSVKENCSFVEDDRSAHHGEVLPLLENGKDVFDIFNVMAYDAGQNFLWKTAMNNYARTIGGKDKLMLGTSINSQWGPENNFVETKENNLERARWQKANGFGGFFTWAFGANTQNMSLSDQITYINDMKAAADETEAVDALIDKVEISHDRVSVTMPSESFNGENNIVLYVNGNYIAQSYKGQRYYSTDLQTESGKSGFLAIANLKKDDVVEVLLMGGAPGWTGKLIRTLAKVKVTESMLALDVEEVKLSNVEINSDNVVVRMPEDIYKGKNNVVLYINGRYAAQSFEGNRYYSYAPSKIAGQDGFKHNIALNKGDAIEIKLMSGVPSNNNNVIKSLYSTTVK
jgi:hypothetical protein